MQIQSVQNAKFTGYTARDAKHLKNHILQYKQGSLSDLYKKFDFNLVDSFKKSSRIEIPSHTQNWKLGVNAEKEFSVRPNANHIKGGLFSKVRH